MRAIYLPEGAVIIVNDNPDQLPEHRRIEEACYSMIETGLGHKVEDFDAHFSKMILYSAEGDTAQLVAAINNFRFLLDNLLSKQYSAESLAFAVCVESFEGIPVVDYSEEGLTELVIKMAKAGLTNEIIMRELGAVKKKSMAD